MEDVFFDESVDILEGKVLSKEGLLDGKGSIRIVQCSPRIVPKGRTPEFFAAAAARISNGVMEMKSATQDGRLTEYLVRYGHTSPLEMLSINFVLVIPIFILRQIMRHRTCKFNERSGRYTVFEEGYFYNPLEDECGMRVNSKINHQSSLLSTSQEQNEKFKSLLEESVATTRKQFELYKSLIDQGYAKEMARVFLPLGTYTEVVIQFDLNNLLKFIQLRIDPHAQREVAVYAQAMMDLCKPIFPSIFSVFEDKMDGVYLSKSELDVVCGKKDISSLTSVTLREELLLKMERLRYSPPSSSSEEREESEEKEK